MADLPNTPEFSVSELAGAVKSTLESSFGRIRVRGEITELKAYASGHIYFALKDEGAKIRAIIWRGVAPRVGLKPESGVEVVATGKITSYPERSEYQLIVERLEYAGAGAMLARIEALKAKFLAEGLFAPERKTGFARPAPADRRCHQPARCGVAGHQNHTISRRSPTPILLWPVPVQGEGAAEKIAAAINGFSNLPAGGPVPRPDVIIVARGGGSLEDLMAFNDEAVVRAAASCSIPLISAVGHETDTTLIDYVADRRAPHPHRRRRNGHPGTAGSARRPRAEIRPPERRPVPASPPIFCYASTGPAANCQTCPPYWASPAQRVDDRAERLTLALPNFLSARHNAVDRAAARLIHPREFLHRRRADLVLLLHRLTAAWPHLLRGGQKSLDGAAMRLTHPAERLAAPPQCRRPAQPAPDRPAARPPSRKLAAPATTSPPGSTRFPTKARPRPRFCFGHQRQRHPDPIGRRRPTGRRTEPALHRRRRYGQSSAGTGRFTPL